MERQELLSLLDIASDALASEAEEVPKVFQAFCFTKKSILAYNDVIGVRLRNPGVGFEGTVPGHLLLKFLKSCAGGDIEFTNTQRESKWRVGCGPTKLDFSTESVEKFPFKFPASDGAKEIDEKFFEGLRLCASVVDDRNYVAWTAGVVCNYQGDELTFCATNSERNSIHIFSVGKGFTGKGQTVLPISFCKLVLSMQKMFSEEKPAFHLGDGFAVIKFGDWNAAFCRTIPLDDANDLVKKAYDLADQLDGFVSLSDKFREVIERAASIAGKDDFCDIDISDSKMVLRTKLPGGTIRDAVMLEEEYPSIKVRVKPKRVTLRMDCCTEFGVNERLMAFRDEEGNFLKLVANKASA